MFAQFVNMTQYDVRQTDLLHFPSLAEPFEHAMLEARNKIVQEEQSLLIHDHFDQETIRVVECWANFIQNIANNNPSEFEKIVRRTDR